LEQTPYASSNVRKDVYDAHQSPVIAIDITCDINSDLLTLLTPNTSKNQLFIE